MSLFVDKTKIDAVYSVIILIQSGEFSKCVRGSCKNSKVSLSDTINRALTEVKAEVPHLLNCRVTTEAYTKSGTLKVRWEGDYIFPHTPSAGLSSLVEGERPLSEE